MRLAFFSLWLLGIGLCAGAARADAPPVAESKGPEASVCSPVPRASEPTVRCGDGRTFTVRGVGLVLPPLLRCSRDRPECCEAGFRRMSDIQIGDLLRVAQGQEPLCHMLTSDVLRKRGSSDLVSALPEIDDVSPAPPTPSLTCPPGQYAARGKCQDPRALAEAMRASQVQDRNQVPVPEAADVIEQLRSDLDATGRCPADALDIGVVMRIYAAAERRAHLLAGAAVDVGPLVLRARDPQGVLRDEALPITCGYNATFRQWQQTSFHCPDDRLCFDQSHPDLMHACVGMARQSTEGTFRQIFNCRNIPPCDQAVAGQCTGLAHLVPLGQGVFLRVMIGPDGQPYYYGLIFSPARRDAAKLRERARDAAALLQEILASIRDPKERQRLRQRLSAPR